ncbi:MAG: hypothetical protein NC131_13535 [Roseburia sp.]|nr:hypothetical protein [Roseburia sp.]
MRMKQCIEQSRNDTEEGHINADDLIVEFLTDNGFGELASLYIEVGKWYS